MNMIFVGVNKKVQNEKVLHMEVSIIMTFDVTCCGLYHFDLVAAAIELMVLGLRFGVASIPTPSMND